MSFLLNALLTCTMLQSCKNIHKTLNSENLPFTTRGTSANNSGRVARTILERVGVQFSANKLNFTFSKIRSGHLQRNPSFLRQVQGNSHKRCILYDARSTVRLLRPLTGFFITSPAKERIVPALSSRNLTHLY